MTLPFGIYITSTPIGNLADITLRAIEILTKCDIILAEDTRVTGKLLAHYNIKSKTIHKYTDHSNESENLKFIEMAKTQSVALVSDAGTPLISDPGYKLVKIAKQHNISVYSIAGVSSLTAALSVSGLPTDQFTFHGFYQTKETKKELNKILKREATSAFFIPARDILKALYEIQNCDLNLEISIARELTKQFEDVATGTIEQLISHYSCESKLRGEAVLMLRITQNDIKSARSLSIEVDKILTKNTFLRNVSKKDLAEILATYHQDTLEEFTKKEIYNYVAANNQSQN